MKDKIYYINKDTRILHIKGFCTQYIPNLPHNSIEYETEQDVVKDYGKFFRMCSNCECEREKIISEEVKKRIAKEKNNK